MIPIITYHAIGDARSPLFTPVPIFEAQLAALAAAGYTTVPLSAVIAWLHGGPPLPPNPIVLTFDDGYQSVYSEAWPRLAAHGFTATVFLVTGYCGRDNQWPGQHGAVPTRPLMDWDQVATMAAAGCEFAPHTHTHPPLTQLSPAQIEEELLTSQAAVQQHTDQPARLFAQPYGATNTTVDQVIRRHFDAAAGTQLGLLNSSQDPYHLPRIDAFYWHPHFIPHMKSPLFRAYLQLRRGLRTARRWLRPDWQPNISAA